VQPGQTLVDHGGKCDEGDQPQSRDRGQQLVNQQKWPALPFDGLRGDSQIRNRPNVAKITLAPLTPFWQGCWVYTESGSPVSAGIQIKLLMQVDFIAGLPMQ